MSLAFCPLYSGSSGNATYIASARTRLLVDAGLPGRTLEQALSAIHAQPGELSGILVTHEHSDHIKGIGVMSRKYDLPVYANEATWLAMAPLIGPVSAHNQRLFTTGQDFYIGEIGVEPFAIPHDAAEPVGYRFSQGGCSVAMATDIGHLSDSWLHRIEGVQLLLLESNHDTAMLQQNTRYPARLKARILGKRGHLSNPDCAKALLRLYAHGTRRVVLGHMSAENNLPELAHSTSHRFLSENGVQPGKDIHIDVALRDRVGKVYLMR